MVQSNGVLWINHPKPILESGLYGYASFLPIKAHSYQTNIHTLKT